MATTKTWSNAGPTIGEPFSDGNASSWCVHTVPAWVRKVGVYNDGTGVLRVSYPAQSGTYEATDAFQPVAGGGYVEFDYGGGGFGTIGADGASHAMRVSMFGAL